MLEEVLELLASKWGALGLGAVLLVSASGRKAMRGAAKGVIKAGLTVSDASRELIAELKEQGSDLVAEVQAERQEAKQDKGQIKNETLEPVQKKKSS